MAVDELTTLGAKSVMRGLETEADMEKVCTMVGTPVVMPYAHSSAIGSGVAGVNVLSFSIGFSQFLVVLATLWECVMCY